MNPNSFTIFSKVSNPYPYSFRILSILDPDYVRNIDKEIMKEVIPFVKKFESLSRKIREEAVLMANTLLPHEYYDNLVSTWKAHNHLAIEIDKFLSSQCSNIGFELDSTNTVKVQNLLSIALATERRKRIFSAGVKHILDIWIKHLQSKCGLTQEEMNRILTVSEPNYYILYHARHIEYIRNFFGDDSQTGLETKLCIDFHAGNFLVMEGRLSNSSLLRLSSEMLSRVLSQYQEVEKRLRDISLEGEYFSLENDHLKFLRLLITYDNFVEYSFGENLFGIPDLLLRKFTIMSLIQQGRLDKREAILHYSDEELLGAL